MEVVLPVYVQALQTHASGSLLDLGCGEAPLYGVYKDRVTSVTCVDWSGGGRRSRYLDHEFDLSRPIPLEDASFDTILVTDVLEHLPNPELIFGELSRLLRPGGKLILSVPFLYPIHEAPHDYYRFTRFMLRQLCEKRALQVVELDAYGGLPEVLGDFTAKFLGRWRPLSGAHLMVARVMMGLGITRKVSAGTREKFPLGYLLVAQRPD